MADALPCKKSLQNADCLSQRALLQKGQYQSHQMPSPDDLCRALGSALRQLLRLGSGPAHVCWPLGCVDVVQMVQSPSMVCCCITLTSRRKVDPIQLCTGCGWTNWVDAVPVVQSLFMPCCCITANGREGPHPILLCVVCGKH